MNLNEIQAMPRAERKALLLAQLNKQRPMIREMIARLRAKRQTQLERKKA